MEIPSPLYSTSKGRPIPRGIHALAARLEGGLTIWSGALSFLSDGTSVEPHTKSYGHDIYIYMIYIYNYTHMEIPRVFLVWKRSANGGFSIDQTVFTSPKVVTLSVGDESIGQILRLV